MLFLWLYELNMKTTVRIVILALTIVYLLPGCRNIQNENSKDQHLPHDFMFMQRAYPTGKIRTDARPKAIAWKKQQPGQRQSNLWEAVGPLNIGGRITDIEIPNDHADIYYVGAASGGIFKTIDAGNSWSAIFDNVGSLSIGDIEISKNNSNIIWVGTGEVNAGGGSLAYDGDGIFRSDDGGATWTGKGLELVGSIGKILIDPNDDDVVYVGAMGALFKNDASRGVFRTVNGGDLWEQVLYVSDSTGVIDMAIHPTNGNIIYAACWERIRRPQYRKYGGATSGLYRSIDGGDTWTEMTNGLPGIASSKGRISIDIAQSNPAILYARYANASGSIQGVYKSQDGGDSWVAVNSSGLTNVGFHWWFSGISVDPSDENIIYNVDFVVQKSVNGGVSWSSAFSGTHVDQHALAFNLINDGEVLLGNDGGLFKSQDDGLTYEQNLKLPITQFYRFYVDPQNGDKIYGGSQDNSTIRTTTGSLDDWHFIYGGDGFQPLVHASNTNIIYALSQNGDLGKSINNGQSFFNATNGISFSDRNNWDTPIAFDPNNSETIYYGTQRVWRSVNGASTWESISPDLTNGSGGGNLTFGTITSIDISPIDAMTIIAGTDDGNVWITQDDGATWNNESSSLPNFWTTKVLTDRFDAQTFYATFSGYRYGQDLGHVFKSMNAGISWSDISIGLPDIPVNDIVQDRYQNLFIATDVGVMASNDDGITWNTLGENLPNVVVTDLHIHEGDEYLYAATYGRSAYKIDISDNILSVHSTGLLTGIKIFPNPAQEFISIKWPENVKEMDVVLLNNMGQRVKQQLLRSAEELISVGDLATGTYYIRMLADGKSALEKIIVL